MDEFFDQNPISQLGIITTKNKRAVTLTQLAGRLSHRLVRGASLSSLDNDASLIIIIIIIIIVTIIIRSLFQACTVWPI